MVVVVVVVNCPPSPPSLPGQIDYFCIFHLVFFIFAVTSPDNIPFVPGPPVFFFFFSHWMKQICNRRVCEAQYGAWIWSSSLYISWSVFNLSPWVTETLQLFLHLVGEILALKVNGHGSLKVLVLFCLRIEIEVILINFLNSLRCVCPRVCFPRLRHCLTRHLPCMHEWVESTDAGFGTPARKLSLSQL